MGILMADHRTDVLCDETAPELTTGLQASELLNDPPLLGHMPAHTIESIEVWSLAKILGVMGLLWGVIVAITLVVAGLFGAGVPGLPELVVSVLGGVVYGVIGGAVTAIIYNAAASLIGGIQIELS